MKMLQQIRNNNKKNVNSMFEKVKSLCMSDLYLLSSTGIKSMSKTYSAAGSIPEICTWNVGNILLQFVNM